MRFGLAAISEGWEKVFDKSREVYACINPMRFIFSSMAFFVHVTDQLQRAHMTQRKRASVITEIITLFKCLGGGGVVERLGHWTCNSEARVQVPR